MSTQLKARLIVETIDDLKTFITPDIEKRIVEDVVREYVSMINITCIDISLFLRGKYFGEFINETLQNDMVQYTQEFFDVRYPLCNINVTNITTPEDWYDNQSVILNVEFGNQNIKMVIK